MNVPTRYRFLGDQTRARELKGFGTRQLEKLKRDSQFQSLLVNQNFIQLANGSTIKCILNHRITEVIITCPEKREQERKKRIECFCSPSFSVGQIKEVYPPGDLLTGKFTYDIYICNKDAYLYYEGANDANFGAYYVGQIVLVTLGQKESSWDEPYDCSRLCLSDVPRFTVLTVSALHVADLMNTWIVYDEDA